MMRLKRYNEANAMFVIYFLYAVSAKKMLLISFYAITRCPIVLVVHVLGFSMFSKLTSSLYCYAILLPFASTLPRTII